MIDQRSRDVIGGLSVKPSFYCLYTVIGAFRFVFVSHVFVLKSLMQPI